VKLLLLDKDGTLVKPKSGAEFIQEPWDQEPLLGTQEAVKHYSKLGWTIAICSNQGGIQAGHKTLGECFDEMRFCLRLFPQIEECYFCPSFQGRDCWRVWANDAVLCTSKTHPLIAELQIEGTFRKPGKGMLTLAANIYGAEECWYIGDRDEDKQAAQAAEVNFLPASIFHDRFRSGLTEMTVSREQLRFLEGIG